MLSVDLRAALAEYENGFAGNQIIKDLRTAVNLLEETRKALESTSNRHMTHLESEMISRTLDKLSAHGIKGEA